MYYGRGGGVRGLPNIVMVIVMYMYQLSAYVFVDGWEMGKRAAHIHYVKALNYA